MRMKRQNKAGIIATRKDVKGELQILIISSRKLPGSWVFPVGTVEKGESLKEAAKRECEEESGYIVDVGKRVGSVEIMDSSTVNKFTFFLGKVVDRNNEYEKDRKVLWVNISDSYEMISDPFLPILIKFKEIIK